MVKEVKIEQAKNGYIVKLLDFSGQACVFSTFAELVDFLFELFDEKAKA